MDNQDFINLLNRFVKVHNQFSAIKRDQVCSVQGEILYPAEIHILTLILQRPGISVVEISKANYITRSAASQIVKKLVKKGFLSKTRNPENERALILTITDKGTDTVHKFLQSESGSLKEFVNELSKMKKEELDLAENFLKRLELMFEEKLTKLR